MLERLYLKIHLLCNILEKFILLTLTVLPYTPEQMNEYLHEEQLMNNDYCEFFCDFGMKEIERTADNVSMQPIKKGVNYCETFEFVLRKDQ